MLRLLRIRRPIGYLLLKPIFPSTSSPIGHKPPFSTHMDTAGGRDGKMKTRPLVYALSIAISSIIAAEAQSPAPAVAGKTGPVTLFSNVRIFDGKIGQAVSTVIRARAREYHREDF